ncbi:MAG: DUF2851 family protein [Verrucomicrobiaceae bacterium]|nr:DUF2851 family protein [Verrucomicrobiaceae bacterium]
MNAEHKLPLAGRYESFHASVFTSLEEPLPLESGIASWPELELQSHWYAGEFGTDFVTSDGGRVKVRDWGIWNSGAGPDFLQCAIELDGKTIQGDIELDPDVRDWERHSHGTNADYNGVILHLFVRQPEDARFYTRTAEHREVPQVQLVDGMLDAGLGRPSGQAAARLGRCSTPLSEMSDAAVRTLLESAAQFRLKRKSVRLHRWVEAHGWEQAIFQALAQTLGYRRNAQPFLMLAQRLPLKFLLKHTDDEREALLFGASGFLESVVFDETRADTRGYLRGLWENWWKLREEYARWRAPAYALKWKLAGTRPGNHPQRRLAALCAILRQWKAVSAPLVKPQTWNAKSWRKVLDALSDDYWDTRYTLLADPAKRPLALLGGTRVQEMLANVVYPLLIPDHEVLWQEYLELPTLLENEKVTRAATRLFGLTPRAKDFQRKLHQQQGLLQLYEDFCLEDDSNCADCPFPERLREWGA